MILAVNTQGKQASSKAAEAMVKRIDTTGKGKKPKSGR